MKKSNAEIATVKTQPASPGGGGVPCPKCGAVIKMTVETLLLRRSFTCLNAKCRTTLTLDENASKDALAALKIIRSKMAEDGTRGGPAR